MYFDLEKYYKEIDNINEEAFFEDNKRIKEDFKELSDDNELENYFNSKKNSPVISREKKTEKLEKKHKIL